MGPPCSPVSLPCTPHTCREEIQPRPHTAGAAPCPYLRPTRTPKVERLPGDTQPSDPPFSLRSFPRSVGGRRGLGLGLGLGDLGGLLCPAWLCATPPDPSRPPSCGRCGGPPRFCRAELREDSAALSDGRGPHSVRPTASTRSALPAAPRTAAACRCVTQRSGKNSALRGIGAAARSARSRSGAALSAVPLLCSALLCSEKRSLRVSVAHPVQCSLHGRKCTVSVETRIDQSQPDFAKHRSGFVLRVPGK